METIVSEIDILLVEDNPDDLEMTMHALREGKVANRIQIVRDGAEALDFVFCLGAFTERKMANGPKMILLDLKLPKVDGREVLTRIKGDVRTRKIPVIVLTSSKEQNDVSDIYDLGANSYIVKPVDFERFVTSVQQLGMYWMLLNQPHILNNR